MKISSEKFEDGEKIPEKYTCDGSDISPPLKIEDVPEKTKTLAIVMDDPDAPGGTFDHWIIWNIPKEITELPEGIATVEKVSDLENASQGKNDFGEIGYRGPCPPSGPSHEYHFKVYALKEEVELNSGILKKDLLNNIDDKVLEKTSITGVYGR